MQYFRCKCGACEAWSTYGPPKPCCVCDKCGSTFAGNKNNHLPPEEHSWKLQYNVNTGKPESQICRKCYERRKLPSNFEEQNINGEGI